MNTETLTPFDLFATGIQLRDGGAVTAEELRMGTGSGAWQIATFHVETDADVHADHWEMHPAAEELVAVLRGSVRFHLRSGGIVRLGAGSSVIVPRGQWHRMELDEPSDIMSVTHREGSRLERRA